MKVNLWYFPVDFFKREKIYRTIHLALQTPNFQFLISRCGQYNWVFLYQQHLINLFSMSHKSFLVLELIQTHRLNLVIWVPLKRQDLVPLVGNERSGILNFASYWFFCTKNLMILLNFELLHNLVQVRHNNVPTFLPNCSNKVMLARWHILNQRTLLIQVCIDHQIKGKTWNLLQNVLFIAILYFQEALVPLSHVLIWPHIKKAHHSSLFDHYHDGVNWRKCNIYNTMFKDQDCFNRKFL